MGAKLIEIGLELTPNQLFIAGQCQTRTMRSSGRSPQKVIGEKFRGIGVSDDYGAYKYLFNEHQLCWAHLLKICHQADAPES